MIYTMHNKWRVDLGLLYEYIEKLLIDQNNDGEADIYPWANCPNGAFQGFVASNDTAFVIKDKDGKFINNSMSPEVLEALNFLRDYRERIIWLPTGTWPL